MKRILLALTTAMVVAIVTVGALAQTPTLPENGSTSAPTAPGNVPSSANPVAANDATGADAGATAILAPALPAQVSVENPYSLTALWAGGDVIARGTIIILVIMSMATWYVLITKFVEQSVLLRQASEAHRKFWNAASIRDGANRLGKRSAFRIVVEEGLDAAERHDGTLTQQIDRHTWITMSLQRSVDAIANRLQAGLAVLATVGSTAPFVGLFGTVWGIYHALTAIGIAGQASIDKVAGPVGEALIMTAIGLAVAVPAVLAYNWMVRRNKVAMDRVRNFSSELLLLLVGGARADVPPVAKRA